MMTLMDQAVDECTGLRELQIPAGISNLTVSHVFRGVKKIRRLTLPGSLLSPIIVQKVFGPALVGQKFDRFTITAI
jgi:hypothetical protein